MSRARQQIAKEIVEALQSRIAEWEDERAKIEVIRSKQDRKEERYAALGELIDEAEKQIAAARAKGAERQ